MIFQDPYASLNPRKRVGFIIGEALEVHKMGTDAEIKRRVQELLEVVGLNPEHYNRFPHEFSGGQRQRIGVARALAVNPKLIVCDEPVSALDVSVQAQILNLLKDLQGEFGLTYVFIAHDLNVVRHISDRVMVMYLGKVAEIAEGHAPLRGAEAPVHGRAALGRADPEPASSGGSASAIVLEGDVPNPINPPAACRFHPRCPRFVEGHCDVEEPQLRSFGDDHEAACHFPLERWPMTADEMRRGRRSSRPSARADPRGSARADSRPAHAMLVAAARRFLLLLGGGRGDVVRRAFLLGLALGASLAACDLARLLPRRLVPPDRPASSSGNRGPARLRGEPGDEGAVRARPQARRPRRRRPRSRPTPLDDRGSSSRSASS